ncbi:hypothetical protein CK203_091172 [Vitis vinifera]|uniref:Uncharacterized protein n=1 Tax=Vitis vinifera TaxID=29760 RepID=A0A438EYB6_VITVI|nr:hypothetical protein CK203_091172 [Vitis vinifera]
MAASRFSLFGTSVLRHRTNVSPIPAIRLSFSPSRFTCSAAGRYCHCRQHRLPPPPSLARMGDFHRLLEDQRKRKSKFSGTTCLWSI